MSKDAYLFRDAAAERTLLGTIIRHGKDALMDAQAIISSNDFALPLNSAVYLCLDNLGEDPNCERFDIESIKLKAKTLGVHSHFESAKSQEYLELLEEVHSDKANIQMFALQIKKYAVVRAMYQRYQDAQKYLSTVTGDEDLAEIVRKAESNIVDFISGTEGANALTSLCSGIDDKIDEMIEQEPVDQVGIATGFPLWDSAIGGGLRPGTITVKAARPKVGKSWDALNSARNIAKLNIPVLYLDTELTRDYQMNRLASIESGCPIQKLETRQFNKNRELVQAVREAGRTLKTLPLDYQCIAGMSHTEALALARRWLVKKVGFNAEGKANDCVIIYDYMKLTSGANLTKVTPEYIVLGLMLTEMHNFCIRYNVPILGYVQMNRDGIDNDDGSVIASSDRILWLCSSMSFLRNKNEQDEELQCGFAYGNKKLSVLDTRQGSGLEAENDYINLFCSLRPKVNKEEATGLMREGYTFSEITGNKGYDGGTNQPDNA